MEETKMKRCTKCGVLKPLSDFSKQASQKDGIKPQCKACDKIYTDKYHADHREHRKSYQAAYNKEHPEILDRGRKKYAEEHKEEIKENRRIRESQPEIKAKKAERRKNTKAASPIHVLFMQTKSRAKQSGIPFTIEETDLVVPEFCPVLGIPLKWQVGSRSPNTPSIDRRIPALGYTPKNITVVSWRANRLKNDGTAEEFHRIADWMDSWPNNPSE